MCLYILKPNLLTLTRSSRSDSLSMARLMNEYFVSVRTADDSLIPPIVKPICCYSKHDSILFTSKDVDDAIHKLKNKQELIRR